MHQVRNGMSSLQIREFMLDSSVKRYAQGEVIFERNAPGSSLFGIADGEVAVEVNPNDPSITVQIGAGQIFGEVGLISGRKRGARRLRRKPDEHLRPRLGPDTGQPHPAVAGELCGTQCRGVR